MAIKVKTYIEDDMATIVSRVSTALTTKLKLTDPKIQGVWYEFGTRLEIIETLSQKSGNDIYKFRKYPLVCLFTDISYSLGNNANDTAELKLNMAIIYGTKATFKAKDRLEKNFKPIIMPIYDELLRQISLDGKMFLNASATVNIRHTTQRKYYWGTQPIDGANVFNDFVDGLEIDNLELKHYLTRCI